MRLLFCILLLACLPGVSFGQAAAPAGAAADQPIPDTAQAGEAAPGFLSAEDIIVLPEISQVVGLSNTAFNRFKCPGVIQDVVASDEKVLDVRYTENDAFVKFKYAIKNGKAIYASKSVELSIVCGGEVFNIVAVPKSLPVSPKISLSSGKRKQIRQNVSVFAGLSHEKKCRRFVELVYKDDIPPSFDRAYPNRGFKLFKGLGLTLHAVVTAAGEGLRMKEFRVSNNTGEQLLRLKESDFMKTELTSKPVFIGLSRLNLKPGESARLFIVEQTGGDRE
jgi:conjugal transfer pilus assembly protein TraK